MLKILIFIAFALFPFETYGQQCNPCPSGYTLFNNASRCLRAFLSPLSWSEAQEACIKNGSHLFIWKSNITDEYSLRKIMEPMFGSCPTNGIHTAGRRKCPGGDFYWTPSPGSRQEIRCPNWRPGEPNNSGDNEECIEIKNDVDFGWNDVNCDIQKCFVCQVDI